MRRLTSVASAIVIALTTARIAAAEGTAIVIESATVRADDLSFDVRLATDGEVSGTQNDVVFAPPTLLAVRPNGKPNCRASDAIDRPGTSFAFQPADCTPGESCTGVRAFVLSLYSPDPIANGGVLYTCWLAPDTPPGRYPLGCANPDAANPEGARVPVTCVDGEIEVSASTALVADRDVVRPGGTARITVTGFSTEGATLVTTDISFASLPVRGVSVPACVTPSDDIGGRFSYLPDGCTPAVDCTGVHAVIESFSGAPFVSGAALFTCGVGVPATTPEGEYAVELSGASGTTAAGGAATVSVVPGAVQVFGPPETPTTAPGTPVPSETPAAHSSVEIGSATGAPGSRVQIEVRMRTDEIIGGVQNDLHFEQQAPIAALPGNIPDCAPDPAVDWIDGPELAFQPPACIAGIDCTGIRALLITAIPGQAIPTGALLYTCNVIIDPGASGSAALICDNTQGSTPQGDSLAVGCTNGRVDIVAPTPEPTATAIPVLPSPPSGSEMGSTSSGSSGCAITPASPDAWWMLVLLLLLLASRQRWRAPLPRRLIAMYRRWGGRAEARPSNAARYSLNTRRALSDRNDARASSLRPSASRPSRQAAAVSIG